MEFIPAGPDAPAKSITGGAAQRGGVGFRERDRSSFSEALSLLVASGAGASTLHPFTPSSVRLTGWSRARTMMNWEWKPLSSSLRALGEPYCNLCSASSRHSAAHCGIEEVPDRSIIVEDYSNEQLSTSVPRTTPSEQPPSPHRHTPIQVLLNVQE
ncbi:unnamed protein product [Pleuronectes platessa]|uniref:Uncharacterized protein n=1 Tax=Pleuronectes platessa TaxID=8262 RepID=A0A9N7VA94_PLEPL|nr:unnamed protein product [Pleuronectes platessa]